MARSWELGMWYPDDEDLDKSYVPDTPYSGILGRYTKGIYEKEPSQCAHKRVFCGRPVCPECGLAFLPSTLT